MNHSISTQLVLAFAKVISFDAAYSYTDRDESYIYYNTPDFASGKVDLEDKNHQMRLTFGFKF